MKNADILINNYFECRWKQLKARILYRFSYAQIYYDVDYVTDQKEIVYPKHIAKGKLMEHKNLI